MKMMNEYESDLIKKLCSKPAELIPYIIQINVNVMDDVKSNYQIEISHPIKHFLLKHIHSRYLTSEIRLVKNGIAYYSAPGWLHYEHAYVLIEPALYFKQEDFWLFTVEYDPSYDDVLKRGRGIHQLNFALIGYTVEELR